MKRLQELYAEWKGHEPASTEQLAGAGSNRVYYRIADTDGTTVIGCVGTSREENHAFITLARHFSKKQLPVPQVLAVSDDEMRYLQTDLGSCTLFDALKKGRQAGGNYDDAEKEMLRETMRLLPAIQFKGAEGLDYSVCYPQPEFDETNVMFDLNYFKYCYLKPTGIDFHELRLEQDFRQMARDLTRGDDEALHGFMYRDFQARNIMLQTPQPQSLGKNLPTDIAEGNQAPPPHGGGWGEVFIDFQGGRLGPCYYDIASFLWQASARYPEELRRELTDIYYNEARHYVTMPPREVFDERLRLFVLFRLMQVLGAYGFRGYFERKQHFINSIPPALENLRDIIESQHFDYPCLTDVLRRLVKPRLVVRIFSFSYKKGIPQDESGNGGGYVFDCRSTHNPGRYKEYKNVTGLDQSVVRFLEDDGEILAFLDSVYKLADFHVQRYLERGFTSLMFSFGCTGGQHRSVYSAQHLAEHLHSKFPEVEIRLCHREQGITQTFVRA